VVKPSVANVGINRRSRICSQFNEKTVLKKNTLGKSGICWASNVAVFCLFGEEIEGVKPICGRKDDCEVAWKTYKT